MTIEEIIENTVGQNLYFHDMGIEECIRLCQEVRRLTIEECKRSVCVEAGYWHNGLWIEGIDQDSFPTDLNNIDI